MFSVDINIHIDEGRLADGWYCIATFLIVEWYQQLDKCRLEGRYKATLMVDIVSTHLLFKGRY